jgi:hypothetical protein
MRIAVIGVVLICSFQPASAQTGNSFVTSDRVNRAPAVTLHCVGPGNVAVPCGTATQPLYITNSVALATAGNQATEIQSQQAISTAAGTPGDPAYSGGAGSVIAVLKGLYSALAGGVTTIPDSGNFTSRSGTLAAAQSIVLFPANTGRHFLAFQVPTGSAIWVNFLGGAATPNGTDCVQLSAGTLYESGSLVTRGAVSVYTPVSAGIAAWEG